MKYGLRSEANDTAHQIKYCNYELCPNYSKTCGTKFQDVVGLPDPCPKGFDSLWQVKTFLGFVYACEEIYHNHLDENPCPITL